ncbi:unnamed protein product [Timema podura]|uniref:Bursicon n=1 Tax=Timema podura TaxID=61482 RepID=A0ABN7NNZ4_TIMPD|nr:unnamed protein product [Timema podura]
MGGWSYIRETPVPATLSGTPPFTADTTNTRSSIMRTCKGAWFSSRSVLVPLLLFSMFSTNLAEGEEACETLPSELHIIKEEFDELGRLQRTCNSEVSVNKCEGACNSQVQPSVITPTGFLKVTIIIRHPLRWLRGLRRYFHKCYYCRESFLRERVITLTTILSVVCLVGRSVIAAERASCGNASITLTHCYDPDGGRLTKEGQSTMDIKLREPAECKCFKCGDFSR